MTDTLSKLQPVFQRVFENPALRIQRESNAQSVPDWDSLMHVNLIAAVEEEFGVRFALGELEELQCVGDMVDLIDQKRR